MNDSAWKVDVGSDTTSAAYDASAEDSAVFVCAHGAGGNMEDRSILALSKVLTPLGIGVVRFNFLYKERKSGRPDAMPKLEKTFEAVVDRVRAELSPKQVILGGRSMGGRASTMLASRGFDCDGLLLFAYPLHPPGQPEKLRDAHLSSIEVPVLCFNGTRDPFCTPELMETATKPLNNWTMHWLEAADHSFHVPKSSGRTDAMVLAEVAEATAEWLSADSSSSPGRKRR
jgi:predicted alpha/beta-hydrolase family hydrolase